MAGVCVSALWDTGLLSSIQAAFLLAPPEGAAEAIMPQKWIGLLLIQSAAIVAGFAIERAGFIFQFKIQRKTFAGARFVDPRHGV